MQKVLSLYLALAISALATASPQHHRGQNQSPTSTIATASSAANASPATSTSSTSTTPETGSGDCSANSGQDSIIQSGAFTINNNLWGMSTGTGSQCLNSASGSPLSWSTTWSWENTASDDPTQNWIKSYANAYDPSIPCQALSDFKSFPTHWTWNYDVSQTAIVADVAYDVFFGGSSCIGPGGTHPVEVMVWLGAYGGLGPIGSPDDGGSATPIGSQTSGGINFNLFSGKNIGTGTTVYSYVIADGSLANSYDGDLYPLFNYLEKFESGLSGMLLQSIQAGTEAVNGSATFSTTAYAISST